MLEYTGFITHVRYYSEETNYIVASIEVEQENEVITMNGYMSSFSDYDKYIFKGDFVVHPKYGKQFQMTSYEIVQSEDRDEIIKYLSSPLFAKVGIKLATNIVDTLGNLCLSKIVETPELLDGVKGMTFEKKNTIVTTLKESQYDQEIVQFFMGHGVSLKNLGLIQAVYKEKTLQVLQENPYQMIEDIDGIGFKTADELALKTGGSQDNPHRLKAAIIYVIKEMGYQSGSTYCLKEDIYHNFYKTVHNIEEDLFYDYLDELIEERYIIKQDEKYYYYQLYDSEQTIAKFIQTLMAKQEDTIDQEEVEKLIEQFEKRDAIQYASKQKEAIKLFLQSPFMILTGGPGTGKTTIVKAMMEMYKTLYPEDRIGLVAPTGRAAKRLTELTGIEACTIHRELKWDLHSNKFAMNSDNPLEVDVLVVDEFSMVDSLLLAHLFEASSHVFKVLFIGDHHQLPSVGPGNVLKDLLQCSLPYIELDEIFRQAQDSGIIQLSHHIIHDQIEDMSIFDEYSDINYFESRNIDIINNVKKIVSKALQEGYDINDIQVLAPMYRGVAGINALNEAIQEIVNPDDGYKQTYKAGRRLFREGDKILQLKNRSDDNVFNGDIGTLVEICRKDNFEYLEDTLIVDYDGNMIQYTSKDLPTITLAYCMSIHKSQGNEFKIVIMSVLRDYYIMLKRNLIYTGITRAKQSLFILGDEQAFKQGCGNTNDNQRRTTLVSLFTRETSPYDFL